MCYYKATEHICFTGLIHFLGPCKNPTEACKPYPPEHTASRVVQTNKVPELCPFCKYQGPVYPPTKDLHPLIKSSVMCYVPVHPRHFPDLPGPQCWFRTKPNTYYEEIIGDRPYPHLILFVWREGGRGGGGSKGGDDPTGPKPGGGGGKKIPKEKSKETKRIESVESPEDTPWVPYANHPQASGSNTPQPASNSQTSHAPREFAHAAPRR